MTELLIAQELFLLNHDDESGKNELAAANPDAAFAGAVLLDLVEQGAVDVDEKKKVVASAQKAAHPLLAEAQAVIAADKKHRAVVHWIQWLPSKVRKLPDRVGDSLVELGVLDKQRAKVLGVFSSTRWPERDAGPERQLRAGLADVLVRAATPTAHQQLLIPLLTVLGQVPKLVDKDERPSAKATAKELTKAAKEGRLASSSVSQAVRSAQAAVLAAVITPVVVTSATASS